MGVAPSAQAEFGTGRDDLKGRFAAIRRVARDFGITALSNEAGVSRQHLTALIAGKSRMTTSTLERLEQAAISMEALSAERNANSEEVRGAARSVIAQVGLRKFAAVAGIDAGHLSRMLAETRPVISSLTIKVQLAIQKLKEGT